MNKKTAYLIINADDYGYFDCVTRGILEAARQGTVTATGIFANSPNFDEQASRLACAAELDAGVHLNLTDQTPLTPAMQQALAPWNGIFPGKFSLLGAVLSRKIPMDAIEQEWRAQIERCLGTDLKIRFLNSHEHLHMLPPLFRLASRLAHEYGIPHVRFPVPERLTPSPASLVRDGAIKFFGLLNRRKLNHPTPRFLGMAESGRLSLGYLEYWLPRLRPGEIYELMCHPGDCEPSGISRQELLQYHDWKKELNTLTHPRVHELLQTGNIRLIGYRHLSLRDGGLAVEDEPDSRTTGASGMDTLSGSCSN